MIKRLLQGAMSRFVPSSALAITAALFLVFVFATALPNGVIRRVLMPTILSAIIVVLASVVIVVWARQEHAHDDIAGLDDQLRTLHETIAEHLGSCDAGHVESVTDDALRQFTERELRRGA